MLFVSKFFLFFFLDKDLSTCSYKTRHISSAVSRRAGSALFWRVLNYRTRSCMWVVRQSALAARKDLWNNLCIFANFGKNNIFLHIFGQKLTYFCIFCKKFKENVGKNVSIFLPARHIALRFWKMKNNTQIFSLGILILTC